jgi:hypothetical protein
MNIVFKKNHDDSSTQNTEKIESFIVAFDGSNCLPAPNLIVDWVEFKI